MEPFLFSTARGWVACLVGCLPGSPPQKHSSKRQRKRCYKVTQCKQLAPANEHHPPSLQHQSAFFHSLVPRPTTDSLGMRLPQKMTALIYFTMQNWSLNTKTAMFLLVPIHTYEPLSWNRSTLLKPKKFHWS